MTTIAYKNRLLVADKLISSIGCAIDKQKLIELGDCVYAWCGEAAQAEMLIELLEAESFDQADALALLQDAFSTLDFHVVLHTKGSNVFLHFVDSTYAFTTELEDHWAIGSGSQVAKAVLDSGFTAHDAITIASRVDKYTGLSQCWVKL